MAKQVTKIKEPIRIRFKTLANGNKSIYLDFYSAGVRKYEFLKHLHLRPEKTKEDKKHNEEVLRKANAIKAQKIVALQNEVHGFMSTNKTKKSFITYVEGLIEYYKEKDSTAFAVTVSNTVRHLKLYKGDVTIKQVDKTYILGFIKYLQSCKGKYGKPLSKSTIDTYYTVVSTALNKAVQDDIIVFNPTSKISHTDKPKQPSSVKVYLTLEEIKQLMQTECKYPVLKQAFLFSCFCGLRMSDVRRLKWSDIHTNKTENGEIEKQVEIIQKKTREVNYLPLTENALEWLPKQNDAPMNEYVFQLPHVSTIEKFLDRWGKDAGITKHITYHISRHTNATLLISSGADIYTTSKLLGHTNIKTTEIYAKIVDKKKRETANLIPKISI